MNAIALILILAAPGRAQEPSSSTAREKTEDAARTVPGGASKGVKACHADIERWCRKVKPGEGRLGACLNARVKRLSKPCRAWAAHGGKDKVSEALLQDIDGKPVK